MKLIIPLSAIFFFLFGVMFQEGIMRKDVSSQTKSLPAIEWCIADITATAYSSSRDETDDTPDITTTGEKCFWGGCAVSRPLEQLAPMGSIIIVDGIEYRVNDRTNKRWNDLRMDVWFPSKEEAKKYGSQKKRAVIIIGGK